VGRAARRGIVRLDPESSTRVARIPRLFASAVAAGEGRVVALTEASSVAVISPQSNRVRRVIDLPAYAAEAIATGEGATWVSDPGEGTVWRVEDGPRSTLRTIDVGRGASSLAVGEGAVWVGNALRGTVTRIDPATSRVVATIAVGNAPRALAVAGGEVWVTVSGVAGTTLPASRASTPARRTPRRAASAAP